ncbi:MAG: sulfotransferase domain-containing protein, partial [Cyanobacteria bacterium J06649_4]
MQNLQQRSTHSLKQYKKLFLNAAERTAVGEASPLYLASPGAPQRIQALLPSAKIIIMLRNPVDRAYSHYVQNTRGGNHQLPSFPELLNAENDVSQSLTAFAQQKRDFYVGLSQYADAIAAYQATFPSENIRIYLFEDFKQNSEKIVKDIFQFLGVDENINIDTQKRYNASGTSKFQFIDTLLLSGNPLKTLLRSTLPPALKNKLSAIQNSARDLNSKPSPKLSTQTRQQLTDRYFQADIQRLETLINRDLSCWLNTARVYT